GEIEEIDFEAETGGDAPGHVPVSRALAREPEPLDDGAGEDIDIDLDGIDLDPAESSGEEPAPPPAAVAPETTDEIDLDADLGESAPPAEEDTPSAPAADADRIAADLEEAEFYWQQGLADEARGRLAKVLAVSPGHPLALVRLGEIAAAAGEDPDSTGGDSAEAGEAASAAPQPELTEPEAPGAWLGADEDPFPESEGAPGDSSPL